MIELWMKDKGIHVLLLQETKTKQHMKEVRKQYTWFFSGQQKTDEYVHGVGFVIDNSIIKDLLDIHPVSDRIAVSVFRLGASYTLNLITTYAPHAGRAEAEKDAFYGELQQTHDKYKNKGPTFVMGDLNARIGKAVSASEKRIIGQHTFSPSKSVYVAPIGDPNAWAYSNTCVPPQLGTPNACV